jgi:hypothetical protein
MPHERGLEAVVAVHIPEAEASGVAHPMRIDVLVDAWPQALNLVLIGIHPDVAAIATVGTDALGRL